MERPLVIGMEVEHAGRRWRVFQLLGPDAVLLRNSGGETVSVDPTRISVPLVDPSRPLPCVVDERQYTDAQWAEAARRRDLMTRLARQPNRTGRDVDAVAAELGLKRRRIWAMLRQIGAGDDSVRRFLPKSGRPRARRLNETVEAIITQAVREYYAKPSRSSLNRLHREIGARCKAADLPTPAYNSVKSRVRDEDQIWLARRRQGPKAARAMRLLIGAHPGASAPWERVQIDSTPCDIQLVREGDRTVIGRPTATFAIDVYSRAVLGFSLLLEAASTLTVAACLVHACLPKEDWLARRGLAGVRWPIYGRPATLEYDQGPENEARGIQRGLQRYGIASKIRAKGWPEQHGSIERLIGTMMRMVHELPGTTFSNIGERGECNSGKRACLSLPELERILTLAIDSYNHTTHNGVGERPMDRYLAYYRQPGLPDAARIPPLLPTERLLLDFLPFEKRALSRGGIRLFRVDYSSVDLLPLWQRDNQRRVERIVVYDPRSLARVWLLDENADDYLAVPYRVPHPDMTLAQSIASRRAFQTSAVRDRTERRLFDNLAQIRAIEATARSTTARRKAERTVQAARAAWGTPVSAKEAKTVTTSPVAVASTPHWSESAVAPFDDVERL
ncbi:transposase family protein [Acidiphilium iwatense]|uniref:Transposase family protein n=1 Tax=Acidiphilium iwatense TaxID=768198 RepID=A0ABS9DUH5_9PROT|nr:transposase family protein [Acidiphilium iwatense]MCF3945783.1 transposase family protein [Acidiphilium iwatense]